MAGQFATGGTYGAIFPKNSPNGPTLNQMIQSLVDGGTVAALKAAWLTSIWLGSIEGAQIYGCLFEASESQ